MKKSVLAVVIVLFLTGGCATYLAKDIGGMPQAFRHGRAEQKMATIAEGTQGEWIKRAMKDPQPNIAATVIGGRNIVVYKGLAKNDSSFPLNLKIVTAAGVIINIDRIESNQNLELSLPLGECEFEWRLTNDWQNFAKQKGLRSSYYGDLDLSKPFAEGKMIVNPVPDDNILQLGNEKKVYAWHVTAYDRRPDRQ